jgi:hypothetical protein
MAGGVKEGILFVYVHHGRTANWISETTGKGFRVHGVLLVTSRLGRSASNPWSIPLFLTTTMICPHSWQEKRALVPFILDSSILYFFEQSSQMANITFLPTLQNLLQGVDTGMMHRYLTFFVISCSLASVKLFL